MSADVRMKGFGARATVSEALALIAARVLPLGRERLPFRSALGRVLAEDVFADRNVPAHPRSAMDGYALRAADAPGALQVVGELKAAEVFGHKLEAGQALRIMTGAKIPDGADAVVMVEDTVSEGEQVRVDKPVTAGQHILDTGCDLRSGAVVLSHGRRLRPQDVSMLATVGALEVQVARRPRVRIVPSGSELIPVGKKPTGSQIVESNSYLLEALCRRDGGEPELFPIVPDDEALIGQAITAPGADLVVISGGSSVGQEDFAPVVVRKLGELPIHGIQVKPASPTGIGFVGDVVVLLAPGYPVASFVAWDLFARPILDRLGGAPARWPYKIARARLGEGIKKPAARVEIHRVRLETGAESLPLARVIPGGAALLSTVTRADGFVLAPEGTAQLEAGAEVDVHLYEV